MTAGGPFPDFAWASGEECSTPLVKHRGRTVRVDELASTGHLDRLDRDLADAKALGISVWRYGMPWHRSEVAPGKYDWALWDAALDACEKHALTPVVDLCHFGLPDHYPGFCDPVWVGGFLRYVEAFLDRYPSPRLFTLVNEPTITALHSALLGGWNDRRRSLRAYVQALGNCLLADLEAAAMVRADRDGWSVGAEGYAVPHAAWPWLARMLQRLEPLWLLGWDLRFGHPPSPGAERALRHLDRGVRDRIDALATVENVIAGHDFYPMSLLAPPWPQLPLEERVDTYRDSARRWWQRYGVPFWVSETSNLGLPPDEGPRWLESLAAALFDLRAEGAEVRGLCWYSRGDQHDWDSALYRPVQNVTPVGLYDIDRRPRPAAAAFAALATVPVTEIGHAQTANRHP